ncbi:hypothetical protein KJI95_03220 [Shewanella sp. JM162201]|uniref:Uncharacterized protein n=1 Tax=Shewanella jiangmenensis TaxID=2837387 RepID=A0ABS5V393_9GAMM|nr:hypothetical protein [Shewanella jiangmenensis]MBT1443533.1 hypothetical protein [Shewanella jiangmenensis]
MELPAFLQNTVQRIKAHAQLKQRGRLVRLLVRLRQFWHSLNVAQRCYLTATLLAVLLLFTDSPRTILTMASILVVLGLVFDVWPRFLALWHSLPGKALILLFYAVVANFALGNAAGMVNEITGAAASKLPYSHNFAILLSLPGWFFVTSLLALLIANTAMPLYLVLLLFLKLFGIHGLWHPPHYRFVFTTALVRFIWSAVMVAILVYAGALTGVGSDSSAFTAGVYQGLQHELDEEDAPDAPQTLDESKQSVDRGVKVAVKSTDEPNIGINVTRGGETSTFMSMSGSEMKQRAERYHALQQSMLADFIFTYEADGRSRCEHAEGSKVVELNDYEILEITPDKSQPLGYSYRVQVCRSAAFGKRAPG